MNGPASAAAPARPCLVLIPGTLCDGRLFARQARSLRGQARVLTLGYRQLGAGARWVEQALARLPARFSLAGFSLGGLWALELLRRAPERIERLALIASNAEAGSRRGQQRSRALWRLWRRRGAAAVARQVKPAYFHHAAQRQRHARLVRDMALATPARAARAQFQWAARRPAGLPVLAAAAQPLLIVSGEHDRLCPRAWQRRMAQARPDARWVELPRCGHFVPLEQPARLGQLLSRWLAQPLDTLNGARA
jgi:pimeloyl-ACP methyl ester carboxylesterase